MAFAFFSIFSIKPLHHLLHKIMLIRHFALYLRGYFTAQVAKLVDALVSEASGVKPVGVRVSFCAHALRRQPLFDVSGLFVNSKLILGIITKKKQK